MDFQVVGRGLAVTPAMKEQAERKLSRFDKYFDNPSSVRCVVTFSVGHLDQTVEINIHGKNTDLRAKVKAQDAYSAIDLAMDKLEKQMRRLKTQKVNQQKHNSLAEDMRLDLLEGDEGDEIPKIVKKKQIALIPMDVEEALDRMEALDHSFYIFIDSSTSKTCILYKRQEGNFGLIEVEA